ncbi:MAG TPA: site-specific integrase [Candidatus Sulfotelmatobacter sp.]|jgi:integrase
MANLRVRLMAAATVNGKRSYYKPFMRSTGWPEPLVVLVNGRKTRIEKCQLHAYYVTWNEDKKQQYENVGTDALTAWQAKQNREAALQGVAGAAEEIAKKGGPRVTVADAVAVFLEDVKAGKAPKTYQARQRMLGLFQESCSKQYLDQITVVDCQHFIRFLRKKYNGPKGARSVYNCFQGLNTFLRAQHPKIEIAGELLGKLDYDEKVVEAYTPAELKALFKASDADEGLVWEYFLWSGCREGEVSHAEWRDLNSEQNVLHVQPKPERGWKVKDREDRFVPIPPEVMAKLKAARGDAKPGDLIFPNEQGKPQGHFLRILKNIAKDANLIGTWELHKFRKTFATHHSENGVSVPTLMEWLGHSDMETTQRYLKATKAASAHAQALVAKSYQAFV